MAKFASAKIDLTLILFESHQSLPLSNHVYSRVSNNCAVTVTYFVPEIALYDAYLILYNYFLLLIPPVGLFHPLQLFIIYLSGLHCDRDIEKGHCNFRTNLRSYLYFFSYYTSLTVSPCWVTWKIQSVTYTSTSTKHIKNNLGRVMTKGHPFCPS